MVIFGKDVFGKFRNGLEFMQEFGLAPLHPLPQVLHSKKFTYKYSRYLKILLNLVPWHMTFLESTVLHYCEI